MLVERSVKRLFPDGGVVSLYQSLRRGDTMRLQYSSQPHVDDLPELTESDCWALRLRRVYGAWPEGHYAPCSHALTQGEAHFCIPLFSLERNVALITLHLNRDNEDLFQPQSLDARLSQFVAMAQSISGALSTIALRESLQKMALTDELTTLSNRRSFKANVRRRLAACRRKGTPLALAMLDIDHFKKLNDTYGHDAGDQILRQVAQVMTQSIREADLVARVGGEEFSIFMEDLPPEMVRRRMENLLNNIRSNCSIGGELVTASMGVTHVSAPAADLNFDVLYKRADASLYEAKASGRDQVVMETLGAPA